MIVKVCGMREPDNIRQVEMSGADWMGFICYGKSPRYIGPALTYVPEAVKRVGVFVNAGYDDIRQRVKSLRLDIVQLHGTESPELCARLRSDGLKVMKAFPGSLSNLQTGTEAYADVCDFFLFDTPCRSYGGSGQVFDWSLLSQYHGQTPFLLSGGLRPDSLEALAEFRHPMWAGIDLNSGFETSPGKKNAEALNIFIHQFKQLAL